MTPCQAHPPLATAVSLGPAQLPIPDELREDTCVSVSIVDGPGLSMWTDSAVGEGKTKAELTIQLQPDRAVVIGRQEGGQIEYLDPRYQPTQMLPNSSQTVVKSPRHGKDLCVSRGHFTLKGAASGIAFVNGVPRRGGGIRPPRNGTMMLSPAYRSLGEGEVYLIDRGASVTVRLPNGTVILICAG